MNNPWLDLAKRKKMFKQIDELAMEVWSEEGTLGDLLSVLNNEQMDFFMSMSLCDFVAETDEFKFGIEIIAP